jgi:hypothetical protein
MKNIQKFEKFNESKVEELPKDLIEKLKGLSNDDIKLFFTQENTDNLPEPAKSYVLSGKDTYTMGPKINAIEQILLVEVADRWLKGKL